jgi:putative peptidoglycan lipid II flippase
MRIPIAVIGQAAGMASYPHLSRLWAQKKFQDFSSVFIREIQKIWALGPLAAILMLTHALPITHFIYGGGKLTPSDLLETAQLLQLMGLGVVFWILHIILSRGFYATQTTWLPSLWGTFTTVLFIPVYSYLAKIWGAKGVALAGTLGIIFYVVSLSIMLGIHIRKQTRNVSFSGLWKFGLSWSGFILVMGLLSLGISQIGIYQDTRLSALMDVLVTLFILSGVSLLVLRKVFNKVTDGPLF